MPDGNNQPPPPSGENDPRIEQALRLGELRAKVDTATGGAFVECIGKAVSMDVQEQFWEHVLAYESAPEGTLLKQLREVRRFVPVAPEELESEEAAHEALWQLIRALAELRVYLYYSNHLSDRDLYKLLYDETLTEERTLIPPGANWNCRVDISEYPTPEFPEPYDAYMAYYADDEYREHALHDFPDSPLPPRREPPFDRDRLLPVPPEERDAIDN